MNGLGKSAATLLILAWSALVAAPSALALPVNLCPTYYAGFGAEFSAGKPKEVFVEKFAKAYPDYSFAPALPSDSRELQDFIDHVRTPYVKDVKHLAGAFDKDIQELEKNYLNPDSAMFVARAQDGKIVACGGFARTAEGEVEMRKIYLDPGYRKQGFGKDWIRSLIGLAKDLGQKTMWLTTIPTMRAAINIYQSEGFAAFAPRQDQSGGKTGEEFLYLRLDLNAWTWDNP